MSLRFDAPYIPGSLDKGSQFYLPESVEKDICYNRKFTPYFPPLASEKPSVVSYVLKAKDFLKSEGLKRSTLYGLVRTYFKSIPFLTQFLPESKFNSQDVFQSDGGLCLQFFTAAACNLCATDTVSVITILEDVNLVGNTELVTSILRSFKANDNWFIHNKIFETVEDEYVDHIHLRWGQTAYDELFKEDMYLIFPHSSLSSVSTVKYLDIKEKSLFYNEENVQDINRLSELLAEDSYRKIADRLEREKLPKGLIILLYGPPGTGKTETVMQLAKNLKGIYCM